MTDLIASLPLLPTRTVLLGSAVLAVVGYCLLICLPQTISQYRFARAHGCKPEPRRWELIGIRTLRDILRIAQRNEIPLYGEALFERHSAKTAAIVDLGRWALVTCDPRNIQTALATNFKDWGLGPARAPLMRFLGDGIFTQDGEKWAHSRALIRPSFTRTQIADFNALEEHIQELWKTLDGIADEGKLPIKEVLNDLTLDFACDFLFGDTAHALRKRREGAADSGLGHAFNNSMYHVSMSFNLGPFHWAWYPKDYRDSIKFVHNFIDQFVERALARESIGDKESEKERAKREGDRYVFLNALAKEEKNPVALRSQIINIMLAGRDTTASLLSWIMWLLARNPEVLRRLQKEVEENVGVGKNARSPTWQLLKNMRYLQAVLHETLRMFPSVPYANRTAMRDTVLPFGGGPDGEAPVFVPKGRLMFYSIYSMQRRKEIWGEDAHEYKPERWLDPNFGAKLRDIGWGSLPFSGGPRICPGQQFALTESSFVIVRLLQRYSNIEKAGDDGDSPTWVTSLVCPPGDEVWVKLTKYGE